MVLAAAAIEELFPAAAGATPSKSKAELAAAALTDGADALMGDVKGRSSPLRLLLWFRSEAMPDPANGCVCGCI